MKGKLRQKLLRQFPALRTDNMKYVSLVKKLLTAVLTAILVSLLCFTVLFYSPGNPAVLLLRFKDPTGGLNMETVEAYAQKLGMNRGFFAQYGDWIRDVLHGNLGTSYKTGLPVAEEFTARFECSFYLMVFACLLALVLGLTLGILSARYHNRIADRIARFFVVFNMSVPSFWLALIFLWAFSVKLKLLPSFGYHGFSSLIMPVMAMGLSYCGTYVRVVRTAILDNYAAGYVMTARAKGLSESAIMIFHVLKNILLPIVTILGSTIASLLGSSIIIENIFGLPGIANYLVGAISVKDYPVVLGFVFIFSLIIICVNLVIDWIYILIDPRVRQSTNEKH